MCHIVVCRPVAIKYEKRQKQKQRKAAATEPQQAHKLHVSFRETKVVYACSVYMYIQNTRTHTHIYNGSACVCVCVAHSWPARPGCLFACCAYWISSQFFLLPYFSSPPYDCCQSETAKGTEREREGCCVHMLVHVHMQLSCFCFTSTFIFSCRFLRPFLMRRKMKSFSGFFSGRFPATSLSATVCLLFCTQMLTFFSLFLALSLSLSVSLRLWLSLFYIFALMNKVFFRLSVCRQAGKAGGER